MSGKANGRGQRVALDPLLTPAQVAEEVGVERGTIYSWRTRGQGPRGFRVGGSVKYRLSEVRRWLAECGDTAASHSGRGAA